MGIVLTPEDRILIGAGCLGMLLATALFFACKVIPGCPLYDACLCGPKTWTDDDEELRRRQRLAEKAQIHYQQHMPINGPSREYRKWSFQPRGSTGSYRSVEHTPQKSWRAYSTSGASSMETSPAIRMTPSFSDLSDDPRETAGTLDFTLLYDQADEKLWIHVIGIRQLPLSVYGSACDAFVKVLVVRDVRKRWLSPRPSELSPQELESEVMKGSAKEFKTRVVRRSTNPVFDQTFECTVREKDRRHTIVKALCYVSDRSSHNSLCGEAVVQLKRENIMEKKVYGKQLVKPVENLGYMTLCLTYLPTAGRLCVNILKATNLRVPSNPGMTPNPQIRVSIVQRNKTLEKQKVAPEMGTFNPVFNQTLTFDLRPEEVDKVILLITVLHKDSDTSTDSNQEGDDPSPDTEQAAAIPVPPHLRTLSRTASSHSGLLKVRSGSASNIPDLLSRDDSLDGDADFPKLSKAKSSLGLRSRSVIIGRVAIGAFCRPQEQRHWEEVISNPRKQFTRTHKLHSA